MQVVRFRKWFLLISALLVMASVVSLSLYRLNPGIDFTGGAAINVKYTEAISSNQIVEALSGVMQDDAVVQATADNSFFIRVGILELDQRDDSGQVVRRGEESEVRQALKSIGPGEIVSFDSVSGVIGDENVRNAIIAVIVASIVILVYVTWAFRRVPTPFRYGVAAIVALIHDVFIVLGVFSVLGETINLQVNAMFITGVLTTIGYSVNDTIVVFDRLRENVARYPGAAISELVNISVRETIGRSLNTSITLIVVVVALLLFAGASIQPLLYVLLAGVAVGTYSSIFIASLTLVAWEQGEIGRAFRLLTFRR
ncbi:MAG: protein translocase subunit SecF [Chloroflexi bacterium]|jgi:preprotein translocase subunit SecF|nr:protein translocase subunit SecF [Chloroflexota bacterium]MCH2531227.1 protein translocase subunit SecF [Dehalococcoidia bacterium]HCH36065.1 protein translocase subunit SecF [Dehalococcoidia bacterium]|tara:strand:+ start:5331 stop:6269 length:939 start_codon:yes stop_codon:yes gene_type:complete